MKKYFVWFLITFWFVIFGGNVVFFVINLMNEHPGVWGSLMIFLLINFALAIIFKVGMMLLGVSRIFPPSI